MSEPPSRSNDIWSIEEDKQLRILMAEGNSARTIAAHLKRTTRAVRRRAERLHFSWRKGKREPAELRGGLRSTERQRSR